MYGLKRVVVTGMSTITALGDNWNDFSANLKKGENAVCYYEDWDKYEELNTRLAAPILDFEKPAHYKRKQVRSMGRVSLMSTVATERALIQAGLLGSPEIQDGSTGIAYGSSVGSTPPFKAFGKMLLDADMTGVTATTYIQMMSHTTPVNVGVFFGVKGRVITTSSACTSGSQGIGYAYEAIKFGQQTIMIAGGAEELCATEAAVFDTLYATSTQNNQPKGYPRPYDIKRDGLVIGEGAGTLILEELEHAKARGATIYAELVGFGTNSDGQHVTKPTSRTMHVAMELALNEAKISPQQIKYVNGHGTATVTGDLAESIATSATFGKDIMMSSLKSYLGHTLGACGAIEAWASIEMMNNDWYCPTANLTHVDPAMGELDYIMGEGRSMQSEYVMTNNFAFGGINTSLIFKRWA
jgi:3-oxoacyl-[acyl-carrier-protein] synthase II